MIFFTGELKEKLGVLAVHSGKIFKKIFERVTGGEVVEQGLSFHPGSFENQGAAEDPGIGLNGTVIERDHGKA
jgi:hypothetical protein